MMRRLLSIACTCWIGATATAAQQPLTLVDHLPRDPVVAGVFEIGDPAQTLDELLALLQRFDTEGELAVVDEGMDDFEAEVGCSLRDDLLAQIGPELAFSFDLPPVDELMAGMDDPDATVPLAFDGTGLVARVRDGQRLDACLRRLAASAEMVATETDGLIRVAPAADAATESPMPEIGFYYSIVNGKMALSASPEYVRRSLAPRAEGATLFDGADFRRVFSQLEAAPRSLAYVNLPRIRQRLEESQFLQGMLAANEEAQPVLEMIRSAEFTGMGIGATSVELDGGVRRMTYGPAALSGGVASAGIVAAIAVPNLIEALEKARGLRTVRDIRTLAIALEAYAVEADGYPPTDGAWREVATLAGALAPDYLATLPETDAWGHPLVYWSDGERYRFASPGKDGQMERDWLATPTVSSEPRPPWSADLVYGNEGFLAPDGE